MTKKRRRTFETEKDVKNEIKKLLDQHGWFWWMPPGNGFGKSGVADFNALKAGTFLAIEAKYGSNKPTPMQIGYLGSVMAEDGFSFVVNEKRLDALEEFLEHFTAAIRRVSEGEEPTQEQGSTLMGAMWELTRDFAKDEDGDANP